MKNAIRVCFTVLTAALMITLSSCGSIVKTYEIPGGTIKLPSRFKELSPEEGGYNPTLMGRAVTEGNSTGGFSDGEETIWITSYTLVPENAAQLIDQEYKEQLRDQEFLVNLCALKTDLHWAKQGSLISEVESREGVYYYHYEWKDYGRKKPITTIYVTVFSDSERFYVFSFETPEKDEEKRLEAFLDRVKSVQLSMAEGK
ncbi:MAG: hypothetical protein ILP12_03780 [Lachnospiraceae bacterium]|nr:hypothetical protein [Lachnospiraceae bacterium]